MEPRGGFGGHEIPEGYHDAHDVAAASAARRAQFEQEQKAKADRAKAISDAKAAAQKARLEHNPYLPDFEPLKDDNGNVDAEGHAIDLALVSFMHEPHRTLNPEGYWTAQRARLDAQKADAERQIKEQLAERRAEADEDAWAELDRKTFGDGEPDWDADD